MSQATDIFNQLERSKLERDLLRKIYDLARIEPRLLDNPDLRDAIANYEKEFVNGKDIDNQST